MHHTWIDWLILFLLLFCTCRSFHSLGAPVLFSVGWWGGVPLIGAFLLDDSSSHRSKWVCMWLLSHQRHLDLWLETLWSDLLHFVLFFILFFHSVSFNSALTENLLEPTLQALPCWCPPLLINVRRSCKKELSGMVKGAVPTLHSRTSSDGHSTQKK